MTYLGDVTVGGEPQTRELPGLTITKVAVDEKMSNNCYLLRCTATGEQALVDAADDAPLLLDLAGEAGLGTVITTHRHWDHHRALADIVAATGATVVAGEPDADAITEQTGVAVDRRVSDGDTVQVGEARLEVIAIAGHTPGSICLLYRDPQGPAHLFTGDSLFPGGVGNTFGDAAAFATLIDQVETKIFAPQPDDTWFYPGHGNDSILGTERPHLAEWRERGW
ncbi:MBL fold metallo-hydrolase [Nocardioides sp. zg-ZUI104]|uniref:MBL fold metallo-hydrolase n=1 Tax=Nocardioides faecalis TaxID=2803858 RepID=UPI001BCFAFD3|nr:MBL fold metallo-hydrolase [Nocardioides faecalis]MBS4753962.1 MBL fold metallo-hydrolase [Nocardioides faecalis]